MVLQPSSTLETHKSPKTTSSSNASTCSPWSTGSPSPLATCSCARCVAMSTRFHNCLSWKLWRFLSWPKRSAQPLTSTTKSNPFRCWLKRKPKVNSAYRFCRGKVRTRATSWQKTRMRQASNFDSQLKNHNDRMRTCVNRLLSLPNCFTTQVPLVKRSDCV